MIISKERHKELYKAISTPIVELRVKASGGCSIELMDNSLRELESTIYHNVAKVLDLHRSARK